jgi:hypothetical protein
MAMGLSISLLPARVTQATCRQQQQQQQQQIMVR